MALSVLLAAIALLRVVKGEYLAPRSFSFRSSNVLSIIESNSACADDQVLPVLTPNGPTSQNLTCSTDLNTLSAIAGSAMIPNSEWLSSPGDGAVELRLGFREFEITAIRMEFTSPLPEVLTVESSNDSSTRRNLVHVLVSNTSLCALYPNAICQLFSAVTSSQTNSSTILEWDFALGRSDVITSTYLDVAVGTRLILTLIGYDEVLQETNQQYYGLAALDVMGRCFCNGHSTQYNPTEDHCTCLSCDHNTSGSNCQFCDSGYQFSPWRLSTDDCPFICQSDLCDVGGAMTDVMCTSLSDPCTCRPNIEGQYCNRVAEGFYIRSLHSIRVEAETGIIVETRQSINFGSNSTIFPDFSGLGYADHFKMADVVQTLQWMIDVSEAASYTVLFKYHYADERGFFDTVIAVKNSQMIMSQIPFPFCETPPCYTQSSSAFMLETGLWAIELHLSAKSMDTQLYIDTVTLLPAAFLDASILGDNSTQFVSVCNIAEDGLGTGGGSANMTFCQAGVFSLSAHFHNGAFSCDCNTVGSNGTICDPFGGQCPCYNPSPGNTMSTNRDCSACPYLYFGPSNEGCQMCGCVSTDPVCMADTGQCNCPAGVTGRTCDQCAEFNFGYNSTNGCTSCSCNQTGAASCNDTSGVCECRPLVAGVTCDTCSTGAFNFTVDGCTACECNHFGSVGEQCSESGVCTCKSLVQGDKCDTCRDGSFYLSNTTNGCLLCACSGLNVSCSEYIGGYAGVQVLGMFGADLSQWVLIEGSTMQPTSQPPNVIHSEANTTTYLSVLSTDLNQLVPGDFYWSLPQSLITGTDWLLSYNGNIQITLSIDGDVTSGEVLLTSPSMVLVYSLSPLPSSTPQQYTIRLHESQWLYRNDGSGVSRATFLAVLAELDSILITALNANSTASSLFRVSFDAAQAGENSLLPIEQCACPTGYSGLSCERCLAGFYRLNGVCVPCMCNGRSSTCEDNTGICNACMGNTIGDSCEMCRPGYFNTNYMLSTDLQCVQCPCTQSISTSFTCSPVGNGTAQCHCNTGYTGLLCDACDNGYQGTPPSTPCLSCECNGNIDPSQPGSCNQATGECLICLYNTTGMQCEQCRDGFYGNASLQQCQSCTCNQLGSQSQVCDRATGQCSCRGNVAGMSCDMCQNETWNLASGNGCEPCACSPIGSFHNACDLVTGQCQCKPGVTGRQCDTCQDGHYSLSENGCIGCMCDSVGSLNASCHQSTGQCFCKPGITGLQCDMCQPFFGNFSSSGCESCSECVIRLSDLIGMADGSIQSLSLSLANLIGLRAADVEGLTNISSVSNDVAALLEVNQASLNRLYSTYYALSNAANSESLQLHQLQLQLANLEVRSEEINILSDQRFQNVTAMRNLITPNLATVADLNYFLSLAHQDIQTLKAEFDSLVSNITMIGENIFNISFNAADFENNYTFIQSVLTMAESAQLLSQVQYQQSNELSSQLSVVTGRYTAAGQLTQQITRGVTDLEAIALDVANTSSDISSTLNDVNTSLSILMSGIPQVEATVQTAENLLGRIRMDIAQLQQALENTSPSSNGTLSSPSSLIQSLSDLETALVDLRGLIVGVDVDVTFAEQHSGDILREGEVVESVLRPSIAVGRRVGQIVTDYQQVVDNIQTAANISQVANSTAHMAMERAYQLIGVGHLSQARVVYTATLALESNISAFRVLAMDTLQRAEETNREAARATGLVDEIRLVESTVRQLSTQLDSLTTSAILEVDQALQSVDSGVTCVATGYSSIQSLASMVLSDASTAQANINQVQSVVLNTSAIINATQTLLDDARVSFDERLSIINQIAVERNGSDVRYQSALSTLSNLQSRLTAIRALAGRLSVAVRLDGNTTLSYQSISTQTSFVSISLFFLPSNNSMGTLLSVPTPAGTSLSISLSLSMISFTYPVSESDTQTVDLELVVQNVWYHLVASQDVGAGNTSRLRLSLAEIPGGNQWIVSQEVESFQAGIVSPSTILVGGDEDDHFTGCVDSVNVNSNPLPLLSPNTPPEYAVPCGPRQPVESVRRFENGTWFRGTGFAEVLVPVGSRPNVTVELWFRTFSQNGLLFHALGAVNSAQHVSLYIRNGKVVLDFSISELDSCVVATDGDYNDGMWHRVYAAVVGQEGRINMDYGVEEVPGKPTMAVTMETLNLDSRVYLGGLGPQVVTTIPSEVSFFNGFSGCMRGLVVNGETLILSEGSVANYTMVTFGGCPQDVVSGVRFMGDGLAEFDTLQSPVYLASFMFKTEQLVGVLLDIQPLQVSIYHTHVHVRFGDVFVETPSSGYADNNWHSVRVVVGANQVQLTVDGVVTTQSGLLDANSTEDAGVVVGGASSLDVQITHGFRGCVRDLTINNRQFDFSQARMLENVALYGCRPADMLPSASTPQPMPTPSTSMVEVVITTTDFATTSLIEETPTLIVDTTRMTFSTEIRSSIIEETPTTLFVSSSSLPVESTLTISDIPASSVEDTSSIQMPEPTSIVEETPSTSSVESTLTISDTPASSVESTLTISDTPASSVESTLTISDTPTSSVESTLTSSDTPASSVESTLTISDTPTSSVESTLTISDTPTSSVESTLTIITSSVEDTSSIQMPEPTSIVEETPTMFTQDTSSMVVESTSVFPLRTVSIEDTSSLIIIQPTSIVEDETTTLIQDTSTMVVDFTSVIVDSASFSMDTSSMDVTPTTVSATPEPSAVLTTATETFTTTFPSPSATMPLLPPPPPLPPPSQSSITSSAFVSSSAFVTSSRSEGSPSMDVTSSTIAPSPTSILVTGSERTPSTFAMSTSESAIVVTSQLRTESISATPSTSTPSLAVTDTSTPSTSLATSSLEETPSMSTPSPSVIETLIPTASEPTSDVEETPTISTPSPSFAETSITITVEPTSDIQTSEFSTPLPPVTATLTPTPPDSASSVEETPSMSTPSTSVVETSTPTTVESTSDLEETLTPSTSSLSVAETSIPTTSLSMEDTTTVSSSSPTLVETLTPTTVESTSSMVETPSTSTSSQTVVGTLTATTVESTSSMEETPSTSTSSPTVVGTLTATTVESTSFVEETPSSSILSSSVVSSSSESPTESSSSVEETQTSQMSTTVVATPTPSPTPPGLVGEFGSYLQYILPVGYLKFGFNITLEFTSLSTEGVLLFIGNGSDFMSLELRGGYLVFSYNLGGDTAVLYSRQRYSDGEYHIVMLHRAGTEGSIIVDNSDVRSGRSGGSLSGLDVIYLPLFVGGVPRDANLKGLLAPGEVSRPSMFGCLSQLVVNARTLNLMSPDQSEGTLGCPSAVSNVASFSGNGYVQLVDSWTPGERFTVTLSFRTTTCFGILFYLANTDEFVRDYISLELIDGRIRFTFDNGLGAVAMESASPGKDRLCSNEWVDIVVTKNGNEGQVKVDGIVVSMQSSEFALTHITAAHPLYIGGVADGLRARQGIDTPAFDGCIHDVTLTNFGRVISPLFVQASSAVNTVLGTC